MRHPCLLHHPPCSRPTCRQHHPSHHFIHPKLWSAALLSLADTSVASTTGGVRWFIVDLFVIGDDGMETQYVFHIFPHRIFGEVSFFLTPVFFYHEKSPWHARRMPRRTPKPWGTLAPSSSHILHSMSNMPTCWGLTASDATSTKRGWTVVLE